MFCAFLQALFAGAFHMDGAHAHHPAPPADAVAAREAAKVVFRHPITVHFSARAVDVLCDIATREPAHATDAEARWLSECLEAIAEYQRAAGRSRQ